MNNKGVPGLRRLQPHIDFAVSDFVYNQGSPETALIASVIERAILDLMCSKVQERRSARKWIFDYNGTESDEWSIHWCLSALGFPDAVELLWARCARIADEDEICKWRYIRQPKRFIRPVTLFEILQGKESETQRERRGKRVCRISESDRSSCTENRPVLREVRECG